jgi:hypothetical protein
VFLLDATWPFSETYRTACIILLTDLASSGKELSYLLGANIGVSDGDKQVPA